MVDAVGQAGGVQNRAHARRKSSGVVFSLPAAACVDPASLPLNLPAVPVATVPGKGSAADAGASAAAPAVSAGALGRFVGRSTGTGQCVALAKAVQPAVGPTSQWRPGEKVQGNTALQPGTVIATFNGAGRYANALDGSSHAAVYLGQSAQGMQVLDQWAGSRAAVRTIPWNNPGGVAANTGSAFQVVKSG